MPKTSKANKASSTSKQSDEGREPRYIACPANPYGIHKVPVAVLIKFGPKGWPTATCSVCGCRAFLPKKAGWNEEHGLTAEQASSLNLLVLM